MSNPPTEKVEKDPKLGPPKGIWRYKKSITNPPQPKFYGRFDEMNGFMFNLYGGYHIYE